MRQEVAFTSDRLRLVEWFGHAGVGSAKAVLDQIAPWAAGFWMLAAFAGFGLLNRRMAWAASLVRRSQGPGSQALQERFGRLAEARGLGDRAVLRSSDEVAVPCVVGTRRPHVLLPAGLEDELLPEQLDALMAHELEHARRGDLSVALFQALLQALFTPYPSVHGLAARLRMACEEACDEAVAGDFDPRGYARALLALSNRGKERRVFGAASTHGVLLQRVWRLLGWPLKDEVRVWRRATAVSLIAMLVGAGLLAVAATPVPTAWVPRPTSQDAVWLWLTVRGATMVDAATVEGVSIEPGGSLHLSELRAAGVRSWSAWSSEHGMTWIYTVDGDEHPMDEEVHAHLAGVMRQVFGSSMTLAQLAQPHSGFGHSWSGDLDGRYISIVRVGIEEPWQSESLFAGLLRSIADPHMREQFPRTYRPLQQSVQNALVVAHQLASHGSITEAELRAFLEEVEQRLLAFEEADR